METGLKVGFTGTRWGMTSAQIHTLGSLLLQYLPAEFHHGCCVGADTQAAYEAVRYAEVTVFHPPKETKYMSDLREFPGIWREPKDYLDRNHDIVDECDLLIAAPETDEEKVRSGTWSTVRYARRTKKPGIIITRMGKTRGL